jgi:serine/threonine protein kinase
MVQINKNNLKIVGILGKGTFGIVYLAEDVSSTNEKEATCKYAIKCVQK